MGSSPRSANSRRVGLARTGTSTCGPRAPTTAAWSAGWWHSTHRRPMSTGWRRQSRPLLFHVKPDRRRRRDPKSWLRRDQTAGSLSEPGGYDYLRRPAVSLLRLRRLTRFAGRNGLAHWFIDRRGGSVAA